jgi:hypothetical protein
LGWPGWKEKKKQTTLFAQILTIVFILLGYFNISIPEDLVGFERKATLIDTQINKTVD